MDEMLWRKQDRERKELEGHYIFFFREKFGWPPMSSTSTELSFLTDILNQYGMQTSKMLIECYLEMEDDFLKRNGYLLKFLERNINAVLILLSERKKKLNAFTTHKKIKFETPCPRVLDGCTEWVMHVCSTEREAEKLAYSVLCPTCKSKGLVPDPEVERKARERYFKKDPLTPKVDAFSIKKPLTYEEEERIAIQQEENKCSPQ